MSFSWDVKLVETSPLSFKSGKLAESMFTSQADILTRQLVTEDSSNESEVNFQDLGYNVDLYIFNQDDRQGIATYCTSSKSSS